MCTSTIGQRNTLSASRIGIEVKLWPAGLITMPEAARMASWIQSTSVASLLDCRNSSVNPSAACPLAAERLDVGQRGAAVDVRLASAKEIQVGAVQDENRLAHEALPSWAL